MIRRLAACACLALVVSCATGRSAQQTSDQPVADSPAYWDLETEALIDRAETLRDRNFDDDPKFVVQTPDDSNDSTTRLSDEAHAEGRYVARYLFGLEVGNESSPLVSTDPTDGRAAHYAAKEHVIRLDATADLSPDQMRRDVLFALVTALNLASHSELNYEQVHGWDATLGRLASSLGPGAFVAVADAADQVGLDSPQRQLAEYPEIFDRLRTTTQASDESDSTNKAHGDISDTGELRRRLRRYLTRQGFALTAALYRAGEWSAAELAFSTPPGSTADVVRPDRWIRGEPTGEWSWPESEGEVIETGVVGPATTVVWLQQYVAPPYASTLYAGYESDAFRIVETATESESTASERLEWISMWNSPASARQVATAFDRVLRQNAPENRRHAVLQGGLKVAVVVTSGQLPSLGAGRPLSADASSEPDTSSPDAGVAASSSDAGAGSNNRSRKAIDRYARRVLTASAKLMPRDGLPVNFEPTRRDTFRKKASQAKFDNQTWSDPATDIDMNMSAISDWEIRPSNSLPLRWLARSPRGANLQWSTTLRTPLDPPFNSETYRGNLRDKLAKASGISADQISMTRHDSAGLSVTLPGNKKTPRTLVWQYGCGDAVHSISLGLGQSSSPERDTKSVKSLLENATDDRGRLLDCAQQSPDDSGESDDEGTIDVEIHED